MGTIADKLAKVIETKTALKNLIISKGGEVADDDSFSSYVEKLESLMGIPSDEFREFLEGTASKITIPQGTTKLRAYGFEHYSTPFEIVFPDTVTQLDKLCFYLCDGLQSVDLPTSLEHIGSQAFSCCYNLESIEVPNSVTTIDMAAFMSCSRLKFIKLSDNVTELTMQVLSQCNSLTEVVLPSNLVSIGKSVFAYSTQLKTISIPSTIEEIDEYAFYSSGLTEIYIDKANDEIAGCPWGASTAKVYWNDGTVREPSESDIFG